MGGQTKETVIEINGLLRQIRESRGIKQIQIAKATGLSKQMVSKMESPEGNPTLETLVKYCECIGVDLVKLLENHTPKKPIWITSDFINRHHCVNCDGIVGVKQPYCDSCGQKLDWE